MRLRALALVPVVSLVLLAGCGDDGGDDSPEAQVFCGVVDPIQALPTVLENYEDVAGVEATMTAADDALEQVRAAPPQDIAEDIGVVASAFDPANEVLQDVGYDYAALSDEDADLVAAMTEPEFTTAADNIQSWSTENCG